MAIIYFAAVQCTAVLTNRMQDLYVSILRFLVHENALLDKLKFLPNLSLTILHINTTNLCLGLQLFSSKLVASDLSKADRYTKTKKYPPVLLITAIKRHI